MDERIARMTLSRRALVQGAVAGFAGMLFPFPAMAHALGVERDDLDDGRNGGSADVERLLVWSRTLQRERPSLRGAPFGKRVTRAGELATGTPYEAYTLEAYIKAGGDPTRTEPLFVSLTRFDCVTLVESAIAVARATLADSSPDWSRFAREVERMRYRGGVRRSYSSRLHYFSEWIHDGAKRGLLRDLGAELGGTIDSRPLRFMTEHRGSYPALADDVVYREIGEMERKLDAHPRRVIPKDRIEAVSDRIQSGDVLAFATSIAGLDVTHSAFAYRDGTGVLRVLHAPLSGGKVEVTSATLPEYVAAIRRSTGILVARPLRG